MVLNIVVDVDVEFCKISVAIVTCSRYGNDGVKSAVTENAPEKYVGNGFQVRDFEEFKNRTVINGWEVIGQNQIDVTNENTG